MVQEQSLVIGEVVGLHGVRGVVKIRSYAESPEIFKPDSRIFIGKTRDNQKPYTIKWVKPHKRVLLIALAEITDRSQAEMLVGTSLFIEKGGLPELEEDAYYWFELIGLSVFTSENEYLGRVASILPTGSNDVLVVKDTEKGTKHEVLVPMLASVVQLVDLKEKMMRVTLPEGL